MGYQAPSAEEVYRYAFRLDGNDRSLTDRFSWSIVLVNDSSPVCRDFLQTYCVELCFRTADRIRFIFFSDLPAQQIQHIAQEMNQGRAPAAKGILKSIIEFLGSYHSSRRYDFEGEPWKGLRPSARHPLRSVGDIARTLAWEVDSHKAMPGSGVALQFAQRLGIGRHVPCILVFTDVVELSVDVLPIERMSPSEVYATFANGLIDSMKQTMHRWNAGIA